MDAIRFGRGAMDGVGVGLVARLGNLARDILTATASRTHRTTLQKHFIPFATPTFFGSLSVNLVVTLSFRTFFLVCR